MVIELFGIIGGESGVGIRPCFELILERLELRDVKGESMLAGDLGAGEIEIRQIENVRDRHKGAEIVGVTKLLKVESAENLPTRIPIFAGESGHGLAPGTGCALRIFAARITDRLPGGRGYKQEEIGRELASGKGETVRNKKEEIDKENTGDWEDRAPADEVGVMAEREDGRLSHGERRARKREEEEPEIRVKYKFGWTFLKIG
jgi:hypothetical protein